MPYQKRFLYQIYIIYNRCVIKGKVPFIQILGLIFMYRHFVKSPAEMMIMIMMIRKNIDVVELGNDIKL